jgi:hypothetical protein
VALLGVGGGCSPRPATQVVVRITATDFEAGTELRAVTVRAWAEGGATADAGRTFDLATRMYSLPGEVSLVPPSGFDLGRRVRVEVFADVRGTRGFTQRAEVQFTPERKTILAIDLARVCLRLDGDPCAEGSTCDPGTGRCVPVTLASLPEYSPLDASADHPAPSDRGAPVDRGDVAEVSDASDVADGACAPNRAACGAEQVDLMSSADHCGRCDNRCASELRPNVEALRCDCGTCAIGACRAGWADCDGALENGCEIEVRSDPDRCGTCGRRCNAAEFCAAGSCVALPEGMVFTGAEGAFPGTSAGDGGVAGDASDGGLSPRVVTLGAGVHQFTSVYIPRDMVVRVLDGAVLDLRASREVVIEGTIDLSGGRGGDGRDQCCLQQPGRESAGANGGGGETATTRAGADGQWTVCAGGGGGGDPQTGAEGANGATGVTGGCGGGGRFGGGAGGHYRTDQTQAGGGGGGGYAGGGGGRGALADVLRSAGGAGASARGGRGGGGGGMSLDGEGAEATRLTGEWAVYAGSTGGAMVGCPAPQTNYQVYAGAGGGGSIGQPAAMDLAVRTVFLPGSGGGGGGAVWGQSFGINTTATLGTGGGGGGGGALRILSRMEIRATPTSALLARGGNGGFGTQRDNGIYGRFYSGNGGGGSGGVIDLGAPAMSLEGVVSVAGGRAERSGLACSHGGGHGGLGRIHLTVSPDRCLLDTSRWTITPAEGTPATCPITAVPTPGRVYIGRFPP